MLSGKGGGGNTVGVEVEGEDAEEEEHAGEQEFSDKLRRVWSTEEEEEEERQFDAGDGPDPRTQE